jgi:signal transduction histidine kinase
MSAVQRTDLESLATALLDRVDGLVESNAKLQSEVHSLQADLQAAQARLDRHGALARLGEMAAGIAHEIRNPLAGLRLYAQALHEDLQAMPESQVLVDKQLSAVDAMESIVRDVLAFAREEKINPQPCLVTDLMQLVRARCEPLENKFGVTLSFGEVSPELEVHVESELVVSALCNLVRNAAEALHEAATTSGLVRIEAGSDELPILHRDGRLLARPAVRFRVQDNGPGVPGERADRIFNPFYTTRPTGTGLGLAIVHKFILAHQGDVRLLSETAEAGGSGATFEIRLPVSGGEES